MKTPQRAIEAVDCYSHFEGHQEEIISLSTCVSIEEKTPGGPPLQQIRSLANEPSKRLDKTFEKLYAYAGCPLISPEQLLLALLL